MLTPAPNVQGTGPEFPQQKSQPLGPLHCRSVRRDRLTQIGLNGQRVSGRSGAFGPGGD